MYNFDKIVARKGSGDIKYDDLKARFGREDLYPLWVADMDFAVAPEIMQAIQQRVNSGVFAYAKTDDSYWNSVINWIDSHFGVKVSRDELSFIPGIVRGIAYAINYFTQKGDKVLIQPPVYHPFQLVAEGNGREVVRNSLIHNPDGSYSMDFEGLEDVVSVQRPKLMILCNPHNPGGIRWSLDDLRKVAEIADRYGMIVISDEIHADLILNGEPHNCFFNAGDTARKVGIVFGAPSKTFNIPGLVSSWAMIMNSDLRQGFYSWMSVNEFSDPTFFATVATEAAYNFGEQWRTELIKYLNGNIDFVIEFFRRNMPRIRVLRPQASFLVWLDCCDLGMTQAALVDFFINKAHLALNDGSMFGREGIGFMRMNIATSREYLHEALKSLERAYDQL